MPRKRKSKIYERKENMAMNTTPPCNASSCNLPACNVPSCISTSCNEPACNVISCDVSACSAPPCDPLEGLKQFKSNDLTAQRVCGNFIQNLDALGELIGPHLIDNLINPVYDMMVIINSYDQNTKRHENNWKNLFNKYTELCVRYNKLNSECGLLKQHVNKPSFENDLSKDMALVGPTLKPPEEIYREDSLKDTKTLSQNINKINVVSEIKFSKENNYYSLPAFINNDHSRDLLNIMGAFLEKPFLVIHSSSNNEFVVNTISSSIKMAIPREGDYFLCMDDACKMRVNYCNSKQVHVTFVVTRDMDTKHDVGKCDENNSYIEEMIPRRKVDIELKESKNAVLDITKSSIKLDLPNEGEYGMTMVKGSGIQIRYTAYKLSYLTILLCKGD